MTKSPNVSTLSPNVVTLVGPSDISLCRNNGLALRQWLGAGDNGLVQVTLAWRRRHWPVTVTGFMSRH